MYLQSIYQRLGDTLARMNQWSEAERFHQAALEVQPDHVATHVSYGTMLARNVKIYKLINPLIYIDCISIYSNSRVIPSYRVVERLRLNCGLSEH